MTDIRAITGLGLKNAKDMVDGAPFVIAFVRMTV